MNSSSSPSSFSPAIFRDTFEIILLIIFGGCGVFFSQKVGPTTAMGNGIALGGIIAMLLLALVALRLRRESVNLLGFRRFRDWKRGFITILVATGLVLLISSLAENLILPWVESGAADTSRFDFIESNPGVFIGTLISVWLTAAFAEEVIFRGFLMGRLARMMGGRTWSWIVALVVSSLLFSLIHIYQGPGGVIMTGIVGFLLGLLYLWADRNLWIPILVHGLTNTIGLTMLYLGMGKG